MTEQHHVCRADPRQELPCCWHDDLSPQPFHNEFMQEVCCQCGETRSKHPPGTAIRKHGPFTPDHQIITVFAKQAELIALFKESRARDLQRDQELVKNRRRQQ